VNFPDSASKVIRRAQLSKPLRQFLHTLSLNHRSTTSTEQSEFYSGQSRLRKSKTIRCKGQLSVAVVVVMLVLNAGTKDLVVQLAIHPIVLKTILI